MDSSRTARCSRSASAPAVVHAFDGVRKPLDRRCRRSYDPRHGGVAMPPLRDPSVGSGSLLGLPPVHHVVRHLPPLPALDRERPRHLRPRSAPRGAHWRGDASVLDATGRAAGGRRGAAPAAGRSRTGGPGHPRAANVRSCRRAGRGAAAPERVYRRDLVADPQRSAARRHRLVPLGRSRALTGVRGRRRASRGRSGRPG
jgi:hypothetical protein